MNTHITNILQRAAGTRYGLNTLSLVADRIADVAGKKGIPINPRMLNYYTLSGMRPTKNSVGLFSESAYGNLPAWLNIGMNHMAGRRYESAVQHFLSLPSSTSFDIVEHPVIITKTPRNIEEARNFMFEAAVEQIDTRGLTWRKGPFNAMGMYDATIHLTTYKLPTNTPKVVRDYVSYMQAIAGAEETTHALQAMYGMYVSPGIRGKCQFFMDAQISDSENSAEHDIAQHFIDRRIPVPRGFMEKYDRWNNVVGKPIVLKQYSVID